jgi:4-amino-4-deoxy-L-arabinose transferase-like glycosyltransferase
MLSWLGAHKLMVLAFALLFVSAAALRVATFDRYLPFEDYTDEVVYYLISQHTRGDFTIYIPNKYAAPTFYAYFSGAVLNIVDATKTHPWSIDSDYIYALRVVSVIVGILTVGVLVTIGWQLAGPLAGWLAGFIWACSAIIIETNNLATPDAFIFFFIALTITMALRAWKINSPGWLFGSLVTGILAIYAKFWIATAVVPFGIVALLLIYRQPRRMIPWIAIYATIAGIAMAYLFLVVKPFNVPDEAREVQTFRVSGISLALSPDRNLSNWWFAVYPISAWAFYGMLIAGATAYGYNRLRGGKLLHPGKIGLILLYCSLTITMASSFTLVWFGAGKIRHVLPVTVGLLGVWGAAAVQVVWGAQKWLELYSSKTRLRVILPAGMAIIMALAFAPGLVSGNTELIQKFNIPHIVEVLWKWTDNNLPNDGKVLVLAESMLATTWNRPWGGYNGSHPFEWLHLSVQEILKHTPQDLAESGVPYFMLTDEDRDEWLKGPQMDAFISQLTLIKMLPAIPGQTAGSTAYFYRMNPPGTKADFDFGGQIRLVGYDLAQTQWKSGETLKFRPYWRIIERPKSNYSMFVHLYPADQESVLAQFDGAPARAERPTLIWDDPNELYIGQDVQIKLPDTIAPGQYRLAVGLYDYSNGQRLTAPGGASYQIVPITVSQ